MKKIFGSKCLNVYVKDDCCFYLTNEVGTTKLYDFTDNFATTYELVNIVNGMINECYLTSEKERQAIKEKYYKEQIDTDYGNGDLEMIKKVLGV